MSYYYKLIIILLVLIFSTRLVLLIFWTGWEDPAPGAREYAITSDDIFALKEAPGRTLVVGAS